MMENKNSEKRWYRQKQNETNQIETHGNYMSCCTACLKFIPFPAAKASAQKI